MAQSSIIQRDIFWSFASFLLTETETMKLPKVIYFRIEVFQSVKVVRLVKKQKKTWSLGLLSSSRVPEFPLCLRGLKLERMVPGVFCSYHSSFTCRLSTSGEFQYFFCVPNTRKTLFLFQKVQKWPLPSLNLDNLFVLCHLLSRMEPMIFSVKKNCSLLSSVDLSTYSRFAIHSTKKFVKKFGRCGWAGGRMQ